MEAVKESVSELVKMELAVIAKKSGGMLEPSEVVKFARNPKTALHTQFDWDDTEAAEKWRLHQARNIIRVTVTMMDVDGEDVETKVYVSMQADRGKGGYRALIDVLKDDELREGLLAEAKYDMKVFRDKYNALAELAGVFSEMDKVS